MSEPGGSRFYSWNTKYKQSCKPKFHVSSGRLTQVEEALSGHTKVRPSEVPSEKLYEEKVVVEF